MKKKRGGIGFGNVPSPDVKKILATAEEDQQDEHEPWSEQEARIEKIVGDLEECSFDEALAKFYTYLCNSLVLPCDVTGIEDFKWEERYIFGPPKHREYERLKKRQPSFRDIFELLSIEQGIMSQWMLCPGEDLAAHVRRKSDTKEFCLGLSELKATDKKSQNYQLLDDYAVFFANYR